MSNVPYKISENIKYPKNKLIFQSEFIINYYGFNQKLDKIYWQCINHK